jgi:hypothetical protein
VWFSRTGAERTEVREHRKRRKSHQMAGQAEFPNGLLEIADEGAALRRQVRSEAWQRVRALVARVEGTQNFVKYVNNF